MADNSGHEKLDDLAARLEAAGKKSGDADGEDSSGAMKTSQVGYEFVGTIIACVIAGWLIDRYLHTKPWGIIGMLLIGFVAGVMNVWRALNGYDQSVGLNKKGEDKVQE